jgi:hypothetical protein
VSNIGYGQDRPYGAIDDDDDFIEEWRASWEPAARAQIDDVIEPVSVAPAEAEPELEHVYEEGLYAPAPAEPETVEPAAEFQPGPAVDPYDIESIHAGAASDTWLNELSSAVVSAHPLTPVAPPEPVSEPEAVAEPEAIAEPEVAEPQPEPLAAPDEVDELELVDWEPQPLSVSSEVPAPEATPEPDAFAEPEAAAEPEPEPVEAATPPAEPDHSVGLTGAAAAALAAASAWGVWGGTPAVPSMPPEAPMEVAVPEPEPLQVAEPEAVNAAPFEPKSAEIAQAESEGLHVPEPEVLRIPEPEPYGIAAEPAFPSDVVTTPIPEPDMYAAPGLPTFTVPEPEPYAIPEPEAPSEPSPFSVPVGETTPIPEPGAVIEPEPSRSEGFAAEEAPSPFTGIPDGTVLSPPTVAPENAPHEQLHAWAAANPDYDLSVDVSSIVGGALKFAPAESAGVAPQIDDTQRQIVVNDEAAAAMFARSAPTAEEPAAPAEQEPWSPPAEPEPWSPPAEPEAYAPPAEPEPWTPPATTFAPEAEPYGVLPAPAPEPEADPFAFTPPPIPESIFAPPAAEESAPAWTAPATSVPEPAPSEPEPAPAWTEPAPDAEFQPAPETQPEHGQPGDAEHSKWFDRAKMWAANNLYDPDEDESIIRSDDDHGQDDQHR